MLFGSALAVVSERSADQRLFQRGGLVGFAVASKQIWLISHKKAD